MRTEKVGSAGRTRDVLRIGVEIPASFMLGAIFLAAFNAGMVWIKFNDLVDSTRSLQSSVVESSTKITRIEQHNAYQDEKLNDHETRLRTVERKSK